MPGKILIVDGHPLMCEAAGRVVRDAVPDSAVLHAGDLSQALSIVDAEPVLDLIVLDCEVPDAAGFLALLELRNQAPLTKILIFAGNDASRVMQVAFILGADGFISKSSKTEAVSAAIGRLVDCQYVGEVERSLNGKAYGGLVLPSASQEKLTPQQLRILRMLCNGDMNKILAYNLGVTESTAKAHVSAILKKFGALSRTQVILEVLVPFERLRN